MIEQIKSDIKLLQSKVNENNSSIKILNDENKALCSSIEWLQWKLKELEKKQ